MKIYIYFFSLLVISVFCIHLEPILKLPFFVVILFLLWRSKKNYFWLSYIFFIMQGPGALFANPYINFIQLTPTVGISFVYIFIIVLFFKIKIQAKSSSVKYIFHDLKAIPIYMLFLFTISIIYGMDAGALLKSIYVFISVIFFILMPSVLQNRDDLIKLLKLLFFSMIILFIWQIYDLLSPMKLAVLMGIEKTYRTLDASLADYQIIRIFYSPMIAFICFFSSLYYLLDSKRNDFTQFFLIFISSISFLSILLTGTRGLTLTYFFILLFFYLFSLQKASKVIIFIVLLVTLTILIFPIVVNQFDLIIPRFTSMTEITHGDLSAGGTLQRLTIRAPRVWEQYIHSPFWGFGFSSIGLEYNDGHVGNHTLLLQGGIIGALIYLYLVFSIIKFTYYKKSTAFKKKQKLFIIIIILSMFISHSTSSIVFTYYLEPHLVWRFALILLFIQYEILEINLKD